MGCGRLRRLGSGARGGERAGRAVTGQRLLPAAPFEGRYNEAGRARITCNDLHVWWCRIEPEYSRCLLPRSADRSVGDLLLAENRVGR